MLTLKSIFRCKGHNITIPDCKMQVDSFPDFFDIRYVELIKRCPNSLTYSIDYEARWKNLVDKVSNVPIYS